MVVIRVTWLQRDIKKWLEDHMNVSWGSVMLTLPSQWFLTPARLCVSTTATDSANSDVSSKEGAVIGAVLGDRLD
jgi:hypothetical protein